MAGYIGGKVDSVMMRIVDVLVADCHMVLLVVLMAVAVDAGLDRVLVSRVKAVYRSREVYVETEVKKLPLSAAN